MVTDFKHDVPVTLRRRAARPVPRGHGRGGARPACGDGTFVADEVLAKHDEKYMPPEVAKSLKRSRASRAWTRRPMRRPDAAPHLPAGT